MAFETAGDRPAPFDYHAFIARHSGASVSHYPEGRAVFTDGDPVDALYYIVRGTVKITVISENGKEAVIALLRDCEFFGERACLHSYPPHDTNAIAATECEIVKIARDTVLRAMETDPEFMRLCLDVLVDRNMKLQSDLVDQLFNSSEKRLARILLTLAHRDAGTEAKVIAVPVTQETLANMVGTTRSRISQFMTKFRKLGYIDYNGEIRVNDSLLNVLLSESAQPEEC